MQEVTPYVPPPSNSSRLNICRANMTNRDFEKSFAYWKTKKYQKNALAYRVKKSFLSKVGISHKHSLLVSTSRTNRNTLSK